MDTRAYYYLWWSKNHWHDLLGTAYPYTAVPLPLPAKVDADGCHPVAQYAGSKLCDVSPTLASQDTAGVIEGDIRAAKAAGLAGFLANWEGNGLATQTLTSVTYTKRLAEVFAASARVGGFTNWLSYKAADMPSVAHIKGDIDFLVKTFGADPSWARVNGLPVFVFTGSRKYSDADVKAVTTYAKGRLFMIGDEADKTLTATRMGLFDAFSYYWSTQLPTTGSFATIKRMGDRVHAAGKTWFPPFTPGYNSALIGGTICVPRANGDTMKKLWTGNLASKPDGMILISWNEVVENTYVEPLTRYGATYTTFLRSLLVP